MSKKDFSTGLDSLFPDEPGRKKPNAGTPKKGTHPGESRATFILPEAIIEKVKDLAYWDRLMIKEVVGAALRDYLQKYEKKNGAIKPRPKNK